MEPVKQCGIYCYQNLINNKKYIGQSVDLKNRRRAFSEKRVYSSQLFKRAVDKYGIENFQYSILTHCEKEELNYYEKFYIARLKTNDREYGYNLTSGGDSQYLRDEEWKKHMSESWDEKRRKEQSEKYSGEKNGNYGKRWNDELRKRVSLIVKERNKKTFFEKNGFDISELPNKIIEYVLSKDHVVLRQDIKKHFHISWTTLNKILKENKIELALKRYKKVDSGLAKKNETQKKPVVQCDLNNHEIILNIFPSLIEAQTIVGTSVKHCVCGKQTHAYGYFWRYANDNEKPFDKINEEYLKPLLYNKMSQIAMNKLKKIGSRKKPNLYKKIFCYDNAGLLYKTYKHSEEAENDGFNKHSIGQCCRNEILVHKNHVFSYEELTIDEVFEKFNKHKQGSKKRIAMLSINGDIIREYESITSAKKDTGLKVGGISNCCYGKSKTCGGYKWKFI